MTQYDIECRYAAWLRAGADPERAGAVADWTLELGGEHFVLNPVAHRWFYFDAAHGEWLDSGIVPGEAVLVSLGGVVGLKRVLREDELTLPIEERIERVASRVVAAVDGELVGPMDLVQAEALAARGPGSPLHVWSARLPSWTPIQPRSPATLLSAAR